MQASELNVPLEGATCWENVTCSAQTRDHDGTRVYVPHMKVCVHYVVCVMVYCHLCATVCMFVWVGVYVCCVHMCHCVCCIMYVCRVCVCACVCVVYMSLCVPVCVSVCALSPFMSPCM